MNKCFLLHGNKKSNDKKLKKNKFLKFSFFNDKDYEKVSTWSKFEMDKENVIVISKEKGSDISYPK